MCIVYSAILYISTFPHNIFHIRASFMLLVLFYAFAPGTSNSMRRTYTQHTQNMNLMNSCDEVWWNDVSNICCYFWAFKGVCLWISSVFAHGHEPFLILRYVMKTLQSFLFGRMSTCPRNVRHSSSSTRAAYRNIITFFPCYLLTQTYSMEHTRSMERNRRKTKLASRKAIHFTSSPNNCRRHKWYIQHNNNGMKSGANERITLEQSRTHINFYVRNYLCCGSIFNDNLINLLSASVIVLMVLKITVYLSIREIDSHMHCKQHRPHTHPHILSTNINWANFLAGRTIILFLIMFYSEDDRQKQRKHK